LPITGLIDANGRQVNSELKRDYIWFIAGALTDVTILKETPRHDSKLQHLLGLTSGFLQFWLTDMPFSIGFIFRSSLPLRNNPCYNEKNFFCRCNWLEFNKYISNYWISKQ